MGKLFRNKSIVTILAIALCLIILVFAYRYRVDKAIEAIEIPIAAKKLNAREQINEDCIRMVKVSSSMLSSNVIRNKKDILEKYVNYNTIIPEGSMFYNSAVVTWDKMPDSVWKNSKIVDGYTVVSLKTSSAYANSLYPGAKIDLYFEGTEGNSSGKAKVIIGKLIEGIEILAVKDSSGRHIYKKGPNQNDVEAIIFAVPEEQYLLIKKADYFTKLQDIAEIQFVLVPRGQKYASDDGTEITSAVTSEQLQDYINDKTKDIDVSEILNNNNGKIIDENNDNVQNNNQNNN